MSAATKPVGKPDLQATISAVEQELAALKFHGYRRSELEGYVAYFLHGLNIKKPDAKKIAAKFRHKVTLDVDNDDLSHSQIDSQRDERDAME